MRLSTNINEIIIRETATLQQLIDADKVLRVIALDVVAMISDRVQKKGEKTDGTKLGKYSEKTLGFKAITSSFSSLANKKQLNSRMKEFGDTDEFYGGYKEFREALGRQTEFIDLTLTGDMMGDFLPEPTGDNEYSAGFRGEKSAQKAEWAELRFGDIFTPNKEEEEFIVESLTKKLDAIFK